MSRKRAESSLNDEAPQRPSQKKTRFASPDEDPSRFEEDVEAGLEERTRKGRVKTEGYDSDSSDDGEGVVLSRRPGAGDADEDDDMFAEGDKKEEEDSGKKKKKEFLRLGDIEGQVFNEGNGSAGEGDSDESNEPEDEDDAERKKKAGMGFELTSFNMREEMEEGKFSSDGTYIRTFDPHAIHDKWMDGTDEKEMKRARKAKRKQERLEQERVQAEERESQRFGGKEGMETEMLSLMRKGETVLEALARLGAREKARKAKEKQKNIQKSRTKPRNTKNSMDTDGLDSAELSMSSSSTDFNSQIDRLTSLASKLLDFGDVDIYDKTYEHLVRSVRSSGRMPQDWQPPSADPKYEYKWDVPGTTAPTDIFGPYGEEEMKAWFEAQYFGPSGEKVKVRTAGGDWGDWDDVVG